MGTSALVVGCALVGVTAAAAPATAAPGHARPAPAHPAAAPARPPPAPAIGQARYTVAAFAGHPAPIKLTWPARTGIDRFRARWTDAGARADIDLPGTATAFERPDAAPGHHELSIVAIDARGGESEPTEVSVDVVPITAIPPGGSADRPVAGPAFAVGSTFRAPGLACRLGGEPAAPQAVATALGATTLLCGGEPGRPRVEVPVVIAPVVMAGPTAPIARETPTRVHITLGSVAPIGDHLQVEASGDLELGEPARSAAGLDVLVTARAGAVDTSLVVRAGGIELGRVALALVDRAPPPIAEPRLAWFALDAGGQVGALVLPSAGRDANALGDPSDARDAMTTAPLFGARVGLFPIYRAGIESELSLAVPGFRGRAGRSLVSSTRAQLAVRVIDGDRYGLRVVAGAGALGVLARNQTSRRTVHGEVHWGAGFTIETRPDLWLRIEALHVLTTARDAGFAHCLELQLGVVTRLGRRDRPRRESR